MKTRIRASLVVLVGVSLSLIFWLNSDVEEVAEASHENQYGDLPRKVPARESTPALDGEEAELSRDEREERAQTDSDHYFNLDRRIKDPKYLLKVQKSNRISQYLNAPRRGDPNYEAVLHTLLRNGFGIEDWMETSADIMKWHLPFKIRRENLEQLGYSQEEIDQNLRDMHEMREGDHDLIKEALIRDVGITDMGVLDELISIPIVVENREAPFGRETYDLFEGDRILTDDDWMTPEHRASQASYQGEPRETMTDLERMQLYREWKAEQLGVEPEAVPRLNRNYVNFGRPPVGWKPGDPLGGSKP